MWYRVKIDNKVKVVEAGSSYLAASVAAAEHCLWVRGSWFSQPIVYSVESDGAKVEVWEDEI
jgi:hypothetical protein